MTSQSHQSGTDRALEALHIYTRNFSKQFDIVINVTGRRAVPSVPEQLLELKGCFEDDEVEIATLVKKIESEDELRNNNTPKVVLDKKMNALYFSRTPIPFARDCSIDEKFIKENTFSNISGFTDTDAIFWKESAPFRKAISKRQKNSNSSDGLKNGYKIRVAVTCFQTHAGILLRIWII